MKPEIYDYKVELEKRVKRYAKPIKYVSTDLRPIEQCGDVNGVYMLAGDGKFYIGQSVHVLERFISHQLNPAFCGFTNARGVLIAEVHYQFGWTWGQNNQTRLIAEARFITAALGMGIFLTNHRTIWTANLGETADLSVERQILEKALAVLK